MEVKIRIHIMEITVDPEQGYLRFWCLGGSSHPKFPRFSYLGGNPPSLFLSEVTNEVLTNETQE